MAPALALAMLVLGAPCLVIAFALWRRQRGGGKASVSTGENPFELGQAIRFGLLFGVVRFAAKAAEVYLGDAGLYLAGAVAGLTDVDAIALSMANLARSDPAKLDVAARAVVIAAVSNTILKGLLASSMGAPELRRVVLPALGAILAAGAFGAWLL
jgi:uncharacterized membrane protein (DUF4010 family)